MDSAIPQAKDRTNEPAHARGLTISIWEPASPGSPRCSISTLAGSAAALRARSELDAARRGRNASARDITVMNAVRRNEDVSSARAYVR